MRITDRTWELAEPELEKLGLILWDIKYVKEGASYYLRIFIDKDGGVNITDCEDVSNVMNPILDREDFIADSYYFEVSSPGLGRELSRPEHFARFIGQEVGVRLYKALGGVKEFSGKLLSRGDTLRIEADGETMEFPVADVAKVKLLDDVF